MIFEGKPRASAPDAIVVHESVTQTMKACVATLKAKGYGVHYTIDVDGTVHKTGDPSHVLAHAGAWNARSIGVEIINGYYPSLANKNQATIRAKWAHKGFYAIPYQKQLEALANLLAVHIDTQGISTWLGEIDLGIRNGKQQGTGCRLGRVPGIQPSPGVAAHHYFAHADGAFPVAYAHARIVRGLSSIEALGAVTTQAYHHE